ncbi:Glutamate-1-semialdehyde 2,1-aminomutase [Geodia barretti]|uniref:Glutamate-1-semialdehyde 2,1-aminomutase n=1 Tax=Geodia barretti TaxID=519541 RepID=A0AA35TF18_GEOBA|nr:Glutamate-1-semialdehyde 2,1-aminomutase [Geodia barretti]
MSNERDRYIELTPKSKAAWEEAKQYLPGGDSRNSIFWPPYPIFVEGAKGAHVVDADGTDRLDFIGTMTTLILGHAPEPVVDAVRGQLEQGVVYNAPNRQQVRLAKLLCERIPSFDLVRFTNSGTEATLNTIRAARAFTGRSQIAKAEGGYHGSHDVVSVSVRVDPSKAGERLHPDAMAATEGLADGVLDSVVVIPFNETGPAREILEKHKNDLAAIIVEPMLGSVGMLPATHEFLGMLRDFATENGVVLIFDEVISFRIAPGGSQEYYGITPDMTSLGKIIGGGFAVGAFGGREDIMELHGLREVGQELEVPVQVTGLGSLFGIHFQDDTLVGYRDLARADSAFRHNVFLGLLNEGILMAPNLVGAVSNGRGRGGG